jgi:hypothetical protein
MVLKTRIIVVIGDTTIVVLCLEVLCSVKSDRKGLLLFSICTGKLNGNTKSME